MGGIGSSGVRGNKGGSGRPRSTTSDVQIHQLINSLKKKQKETGKNWTDIVIDFAYNDNKMTVKVAGKTWIKPEVEVKDRLKALDIIKSMLVIPRSEQVVEQKKINIVEMPALDDDPAKKLIEEKKVEPMSIGFIQ